MRSVLGWMTTSGAQRILNSANSREIRVEQKALSVVTKMRESTTSVTTKQKFLNGY